MLSATNQREDTIMNRIAATALALFVTAGAAAADPIEGLWRTIPDDNGNSGLIQVAPCGGGAYCGTLIRAYDSSGAEVSTDTIGTQIISATVPEGDGSYRGKVYAPDRDRTYNSRLQINGNSLSVSGCVLGVCRDGGTWQRQ